MDTISMVGSSALSPPESFLPSLEKNGLKEASGKPSVAVIGSGDFSRCLTLRLLRCGFRVAVGSRRPNRVAPLFPHVVDVTNQEEAAVYVCGNSVEARQQVAELARRLHFVPVDMGTLSSAREIENMPLHLFSPWRGPVLATVSLSILFFIYSFVRDIVHPYVRSQQSNFYKIPVEIVNKTLPVVAITLLALVYLAGLLAAGHQLYYRTKYRRFPHWLEDWLQCRKQFGLLSFFFAGVHVLYSLCLPLRRSERYLVLNTAFQQVRADVESSWNEEEVWRVEMYLSFGIMSLGLLSLLALTSIPSVNSALNWREFSFIQSTLGYIALLIATFHALLFGWRRAFQPESYRFYLPPSFVVALVLPVTVIVGKAVLLLPCVGRRLRRIRRGSEDGCRRRRDDPRGSAAAAHVSPERVTIM
ncbi:metalloreductase STEAP2-like [Conger conger]|uniref:metalloreductase STEAP2-like n=1 Tax=Conger conger TaxID=82655 RepID=UPI002A59C109|nr:metalloreductase STEAP2-like [Conger conger]